MAAKKDRKVHVTATLDKEVVQYLESLSAKTGLNRSLLINAIVRKERERDEKEQAPLFGRLTLAQS